MTDIVSPSLRSPYIFKIVDVVKVVDGDSYWLRVDVGFRALVLINVRLLGFDCPEAHRGSAHEKAMAIQARLVATDFLELWPAQLWIRTERDPDSFGRWLGDIWAEDAEGGENSLGEQLHTEDLASRWPDRWRDVYEPALLEGDLEFEYYHAEDQPVHSAPRGVLLRYKPTGQVFQSSTRKSQLENKEVVIGLIREALR